MRKTRESRTTPETICIDTANLQELLQVGRATAVEIGTQANAKIKIGRRVVWNTEKIRKYVNSISQ